MIKPYKLKVGDRVKILTGTHKNEQGIVVDTTQLVSGHFVGIHCDNYAYWNHDCNRRAPSGHGWWVKLSDIELIYEQGSLDSILFNPYEE